MARPDAISVEASSRIALDHEPEAHEPRRDRGHEGLVLRRERGSIEGDDLGRHY